MATRKATAASPARGQGPSEQREYALMLEVERYESLAEEMEELGVATLAEVRQRILALHQQLDVLQP